MPARRQPITTVTLYGFHYGNGAARLRNQYQHHHFPTREAAIAFANSLGRCHLCMLHMKPKEYFTLATHHQDHYH